MDGQPRPPLPASGQAPAGLVRRLSAALIDVPLSLVPFAFFLILLNGGPSLPRRDALGLGLWAAGGEWSDARDVAVGVSIAILSLALSMWIYLFACRWRWGRPLGKRLASIRVVDTRGEEATFQRAYTREIAKAVIFVVFSIGLPIAAVLIIALALLTTLCNYGIGEVDYSCAFGAVAVSAGTFPVISIGGVLLLWLVPFKRKDKRALHDLLTGTMVVSPASGAEQEGVDRMDADAPALAPAGAMARLGATALDATIAMVPLFLFDPVATAVDAIIVRVPLFLFDALQVAMAAVLWTAAYLAASIGLAGQTLGKRAFRLRVVQADGGNPGRNLIFVHELIKYASIYGVLLLTSALFFPTRLGPFLPITILVDGVRNVVTYGDSLVSFALVASVITIPASVLAIPIVFRKDKRALHDLLIGATVVSEAGAERPAS